MNMVYLYNFNILINVYHLYIKVLVPFVIFIHRYITFCQWGSFLIFCGQNMENLQELFKELFFH